MPLHATIVMPAQAGIPWVARAQRKLAVLRTVGYSLDSSLRWNDGVGVLAFLVLNLSFKNN